MRKEVVHSDIVLGFFGGAQSKFLFSKAKI